MMGTPGVPNTVKKQDLEASIKKRKGVASKVQKDLNIGHNLFYRLIEKFELQKLLNEERNAYAENLCDIAEGVLHESMMQREEINAALGAAKFVLNNKGRDRGYYPPVAPPPPKDEMLNEIRIGIKELSQEPRGKAASRPEVAS